MMHCCISVCGNTASIVCGNPVSPSTHVIKISSTPRFFNPLMIKPKFSTFIAPTYIQRTSFLPSMLTLRRYKQHVLQFGLHFAHDSGLHPYKQLHRLLQGLFLPFFYDRKDLICNPADRTVDISMSA